MTQSNSAQTEELSATAESLAQNARKLQALLAKFRIRETPESAPSMAWPSPVKRRPVRTRRDARSRTSVRPASEIKLLASVPPADGAETARANGFDEF